ncbi:MAG: phosphomannomutase/phosphoglucomutase [Phycisphaerales bacterium]|nr:phosphomannomutase/phosphoglucomutase [Phycisphaerales bacterium]
MSQKLNTFTRYCPGEEQIRISDAVCIGRRRVHFHKCAGCQFNDDERHLPVTATAQSAPPAPQHAESGPDEKPTSSLSRAGSLLPEPPARINLNQRSPLALPPRSATGRALLMRQDDKLMIEKVFKAYDVRGTVPDQLNEDAAWRIGNAAAQFLRTSLTGYDRSDEAKNTLIVGRDIRKHSPSLSHALIEGARATGARVIDIGLVDTSQIYFATNHLPCCGGVMVTASHNPANYNGFKICGPKGKPIGQDTGLREICRIAVAISRHRVPETEPPRQVDLSMEYRAYLHRFLTPPRPMKVVIDASNGSAGRWFPILFSNVPNLTVIPLNFEHNGDFTHPPNPLVAANLDQLRAAVREHSADFGACFDGDADRCMFVDEKAGIVRCDVLTALLAGEYLRERPGSTVVYDLRSSRAVPDAIRKAGGIPRRERVGHVFMKRTMAEHDAVFGGELSGHFYFRDFFYCDSGLFAFVAVLNLMTRTGRPLSELLAPHETYFASGEQNFENPDKDATVQYADWWFNVRASNTEPLLRLNMEASSVELLNRRMAELSPMLGKQVDH